MFLQVLVISDGHSTQTSKIQPLVLTDFQVQKSVTFLIKIFIYTSLTRHVRASVSISLRASFRISPAQTTRSNWQSLSAGGSVAIQTWSTYEVYT